MFTTIFLVFLGLLCLFTTLFLVFSVLIFLSVIINTLKPKAQETKIDEPEK